MKQSPEIKGKILADLHCHPGRNNSAEDLAEMLSWGITGLASFSATSGYLSYEDAMQLPNVREIDLGLFAEIEYNGKKGYFARAQEVSAGFHILALGCYNTIHPLNDARNVIEKIHKEKGIAILNHPYVISTGRKIIRYRLANEAEEKKLEELCGMADEVEVFNAQNINLLPVVAWMKNANEKAKELAARHDFKGIAASDAHRLLSQVKTAGIYLPSENLCIDAVKEHIKKGNFERCEKYVSRRSFLKGMFFS
ncbi:MAG: PHP-associated domain-containing protein [Nanoarchaeota archaeon]|nr:PHP-associated domain-containing protein [Nanoarchaeota archaeon]